MEGTSRKWGNMLLGIFFISIWLFVASPSQPQELPARSKTLIVAQAGDVSSVDEHQLAGVAKNALIQIYDWQWMRHPTVTLPNGTLVVNTREIVPGIITSWKTEKQANGITIHRLNLRKGALHHSGNPVTAEDFKYAILRNAALGRDTSERNLGGMYSESEGLADSIRIIDPLTLEIRTKKNLPMFFNVFTMRTYFDSKLAKQHSTKEDPWSKDFIGKNDVGSGPYKIERWETGTEMRLKRFKDYWGPPPSIETIVFRTVPDLSARMLLLKNGDVDVALDIPLREMQSLKGDPNVKVTLAPSTTKVAIGMNQAIPPFDKKDLRLALAYAFPYDSIIPAIYQGSAKPLNGPIPTGILGALPERRYKTDLARAKEHLKNAGLDKGLKLTLKWETGRPQFEQMGILFMENLKKIGVELKLQQLPKGQFQAGRRSKNLDFYILDGLAWIATPEFETNLWYFTKGPFNDTNYTNPRVDKLIDSAMSEMNEDRRVKYCQEAQDIILNEMPYIYIAQPDFQLAMRSNVRGYVVQNTEMHHFWLVDKN
jgi:peptide/nickel transport system substrate-binding protein